MDLPEDYSKYIEKVLFLIEKGYLSSNVDVDKIAQILYNNEMNKQKEKPYAQ